MSQIRKFSFLYDAAEDRLACDTEAADGATTRLWLTQRFCRDLVEAILPFLEKSVAAPAAEHQAVVQSWEQVAAMADFGKTPAVEVSPKASSGLVQAAHLTPRERGLDVAFDFGEGEQRSIPLAFTEVRQMLSVMHRLHVAAGWPVDLWPAWISDPAAVAAPTQSLN
jgi:hypothetical protein